MTLTIVYLTLTWWSGYCSHNKGECSLNQSNVDSFVGRVAKDNSENNGDRHKIHKVFPTNRFVLVVTLVWKIVYSSATAQITAYLQEKTLQLTIPWKRFLLQLVWQRNALAIKLSWWFFHPDLQVEDRKAWSVPIYCKGWRHSNF